MDRMLKCLIVGLLLFVPAHAVPGSLSVHVIAPSVSTSMEAQEIMGQQGWSEVGLRRADAILVVVRSSLNNPLLPSYRSVCDLTEDAENQLNIAGPLFHVYLYTIEDDMSSTEAKHVSYKAD